MKSTFKKIGKIKDAHGLKGELKVLVFSGSYDWVSKLKTFQLVSPNTNKSETFEVKTTRMTPDFLLLTTARISDRTQAEGYRGWDFLVPEELFVSEPGETIYLGEIKGFRLADGNGTELGHIVGFSSNGLQDLLQIEVGNHIFEVPFIDEFLEKISFETKTVIMNLPPGLFDPELVGGKKS